jgi:tetratricopeptide (TPR) repeat protein
VSLASAPHYGATVLRVYERRDERRRYAVFTVWITLALLAATAASFHVPLVGSLLVTANVTWAPWHFAGQNYGVGLMFLRRQGVDVQPGKRLLYASFLLSWVLAFLAIHVESSTAAYTVPMEVSVGRFDVLRLGIPRATAQPLFVAGFFAYAGVTLAAFVRLRRQASLATLAPAILLVLTQACWFSVPAWLDLNGLRDGQGLVFATMWINAGHSFQYLWVTSYYDRALGRARSTPRYLLQVLLVGNAVVVLPGLLFAPWLLGNVAWDRGLSLLIFSIVNLHHFILDGAIWKLRDGRVARALLRDAPPAEAAGGPAASRPRARARWTATAVAGVGAVCLWAQIDELLLHNAIRWGRTDMTRAVLERLDWFGRDYAHVRLQLGRDLMRSGSYGEALAQFEVSLALAPSVAAWRGKGRALEKLGQPAAAAEAFREALVLAPDQAALREDVERTTRALPQDS